MLTTQSPGRTIGRRRSHSEISTSSSTSSYSTSSTSSSSTSSSSSSSAASVPNLNSPFVVSPNAPSLASSEGDSTPLYARFGLTQNSTNSSIYSLSGSEDESPGVHSESEDESEDEDDDTQVPNRAARINNALNAQVLSRAANLLALRMMPAAKKTRFAMTPTQKVQESITMGQTTTTLFWALVDNKVMQKHHIDLLNADVATLRHSRIGLLCHPTKYTNATEANLAFQEDTASTSFTSSTSFSGPSLFNSSSIASTGTASSTSVNHGFWAMYFPMSELNGVWSGLVSHCFFWGDHYGSKIVIDLVKSESELAQHLQKMNKGTAWKDTIGFDTVSNLIKTHAIDQQVLCCRLRVDLPRRGTELELKKTGERLLQIMPATCRGPLYFAPKCPPQQSNVIQYFSGSSTPAPIHVPTNHEQATACTYRMHEEIMAVKTKDGRVVGQCVPPVVPCSEEKQGQFIRDDDNDIDGDPKMESVLYVSDGGMAWRPCPGVGQ